MPCEALDPPEYLPIPALRQIALGQLEDEKYRACRLRQLTRPGGARVLPRRGHKMGQD